MLLLVLLTGLLFWQDQFRLDIFSLLLLITAEGDGDGRLHLDGYRPEATGFLGRPNLLF